MPKYEIVKITNGDDPERCKAVSVNGIDCGNKYLKVDNEKVSDFCAIHGGNSGYESLKKEKVRNYRLTKFQARVEQKSDNSSIKDLSEEVGILRMVLEELLNSFETTADLIIAVGPISELIVKIEKLVTSSQKLDEKLSRVLDRNQLTQIASQLVTVLEEEITNEDQLLAITSRFEDVILSL